MKSLILVSSLMLISISAFATTDAKDCRAAIVDASISLKEPLSPESFSSNNFTDFNMTPEEYNALPSSEQVVIYQQVKPLEVMVEEMVARVNRTINYLNEDVYIRLFQSELIDQYRDVRDELRACI